ncbi:hypothetical protein DSO57_1027166 [Entomophthora muscae]|uniref:Uncharacterized protein n=1 Tax=Entomophthora muscae TaxID=34485 RepID=A0ACC2TPC4_9FUNG|nr:hypothetical protein DSO57_1027166 [Entomophthora muscae]
MENEKKSTSRGLKSKSQTNQFPVDRTRAGIEQRSLLDFGDEVDFLSRSLSRANLDGGFGSFGASATGNNLNFYTPQPKTSQLASIFASPNPSQFSMSLPGMQPYPSEEKFPSTNSFFTSNQAASSFSDRIRGDFIASNFNFGFSDEHDLLPSSLDELLTPTELQMRRTKASMMSRPGFMNRSQTQESLGLSPAASKALNDFDGYFPGSLPSGSSLGITERHALQESGDLNASTLLGQSFNSDDIHVVMSEQDQDLKDGSSSSQSFENKKEDGASVSTGMDDDIPFHMDGDF